MNKTQFYTFIILLISVFGFGQEDSLTISEPKLDVDSTIIKNDSITVENDTIAKKKQKRKLFVGIDLYQPILTAVTNKTSGQAFANMRIKNKWHGVVEAGFESNTFEDLDWNIDANGPFIRVGVNWFLSEDIENPDNGFYTGLRLAYSTYTQTINEFPIRGTDDQGLPVSNVGGPLPDGNVSAYWIEPVVGGRVKLFNTNFYADISGRLQLLLGGTEQDGFENLVIPGFGRDNGGVNGNILWGISYQF